MTDIMYFSTSWCQPCKMFKPVVQQVATETGRHVTYVDAELSTDLASKYGIRSVPAIVVVEGDRVLYQHVGVLSKQQVVSLFNNYR